MFNYKYLLFMIIVVYFYFLTYITTRSKILNYVKKYIV